METHTTDFVEKNSLFIAEINTYNSQSTYHKTEKESNIDHFFLSGPIPAIPKCDIIRHVKNMSDHNPISISLELLLEKPTQETLKKNKILYQLGR